MIGLLSIWAACFFWAMVFAEIDRKYMREDFYEYYEQGLILFLITLISPIAFILGMIVIHEDAK